MKNKFLDFLGLIILPFILMLAYPGSFALLFIALLVTFAIAGVIFGSIIAINCFIWMCLAYAGLVIFTFVFLTTFCFQNCCVGMNTFCGHLMHRGWKGAGEDLISSIIWPWSWYRINCFLIGWYSNLLIAVCNAFEYWLVSSWRGVSFTSIDFQTGESTTVYVKTPEETYNALHDAIANDARK